MTNKIKIQAKGSLPVKVNHQCSLHGFVREPSFAYDGVNDTKSPYVTLTCRFVLVGRILLSNTCEANVKDDEVLQLSYLDLYMY